MQAAISKRLTIIDIQSTELIKKGNGEIISMENITAANNAKTLTSDDQDFDLPHRNEMVPQSLQYLSFLITYF